MRHIAILLAVPAALGLTACGAAEEEPQAVQPTAQSEAEDFAARINAGKSQQAAAEVPAIVPQTPAPVAAPVPVPVPVAPAPIPPKCKSDEMRAFLGRPADDATRQEIMAASQSVAEVRFISPGSDYIKPDPTHPRLNIMIDTTGVIRDARCG